MQNSCSARSEKGEEDDILGSLEAAVRIQRVVRSMEEVDEAREVKDWLIGYVNRASAFLSAH